MDVEIADRDLLERHNGGTIRPILQDSYVSGASFLQLFFWNRVLFVTSLVLCISQCLASGLLLSNTFPLNWPGNDLQTSDMWLPELFGGLLGLSVMLYCRHFLCKAKNSALRAQKADLQNGQRFYIPWSGANSTARASLLWMIFVPTLICLGLFGVSAASLATSIRVVRELETKSSYADTPSYADTLSYTHTASYTDTAAYANTPSYAHTASYADTPSYAHTASYADTPSYAHTAAYADTPSYVDVDDVTNEVTHHGHALAAVLLCLHLLIVFCKFFVLVLGIVIPVVILIMAKCACLTKSGCFKRFYPFAVYLDTTENARPLLIEL